MTQQTDNTRVLIAQGNRACVEGALAAGCRFFAGYPITPASEIAELMSHRLPEVGGVFMQMEDEIASICAAIGAAWGGMKACTASSGPGISLKQENVSYALATETPLVIFNVMRGGPSTGQPTMPSQQDIMQARYGAHGDYELIALMPSSAQEAFDFTVRAFNLAERYRVPVYVLSDEIVGHAREKLRIPEELEVTPRKPPEKTDDYLPFRAGPDGLLDGMPSFNQGHNLVVDGQLHDEAGNRAGHLPEISGPLVQRLNDKVTDNIDEITQVQKHFTDEATTVVVCFGSPARPALQAVKEARAQGHNVGLLKLDTVWPFPDHEIEALLDTAQRLVVPELNVGRIVREVQRVAAGRAQVSSLPRVGGLLHTPREIHSALLEGGGVDASSR